MNKRLLAVGVGVSATALALSACSGTAPKAGSNGGLKKSTSVNVSFNQPFYSANSSTDHGNATANNNILYMTNDSFTYYTPNLQRVPNNSYGTMTRTSESPLTVQYKLADTAKWSDGVPVTAADLMLTWAALSNHYNNVSADKGVNKDGNPVKQSGNNVFFETSDPGLALVKKLPTVSDDNKTVTIQYSKPFVDWKDELTSPSVPAHVVAQHALGIKDANQADQAVMKAIQSDDKATLSKLANFWNTGFDFKSMPSDKSLVVGSGPFTISDYKKDQYISLTRNKNYQGEHKPKVDKITVRYQADPMAAVQALDNGEVDMIQPQSTADVLKAVQKLKNVKYKTGDDATFEHIDLAENNGGPFDPKSYGGNAEKARMVRQAFLDTIPRDDIVNKLIKPLNPQATVRNSFTTTPGSPGYNEIVAANKMAQTDKVDIAAAKALLKKAGNAHPTVRFLTDKVNTRRQQEYQLISESAQKAGFKMVNASSPDWGELLTQTNKYDATLFGWQSTSTGVSSSVSQYITGGQNNFYGYSDKKVDNWLGQLQVSTSQQQAVKLQSQVEAQLVKDAFGTTIFQFPQLTAWNTKVANVSTMTLAPTNYWNFWQWQVNS